MRLRIFSLTAFSFFWGSPLGRTGSPTVGWDKLWASPLLAGQVSVGEGVPFKERDKSPGAERLAAMQSYISPLTTSRLTGADQKLHLLCAQKNMHKAQENVHPKKLIM